MLRNILTGNARGFGSTVARVAAVLPWLALACTDFEPGSDELSPDMVTLEQQPEVGRDWSCLRQEEGPSNLVASPVGTKRLVQSLRVLSLASGAVVPGISVRACAQRDVSCTAPLTENIPLGADGWVDLPLYEGFDGFLEITGESVLPAALFYADPLSPGGEVDNTPLGLLELAIVADLSGATGTRQDLQLGLVVLRTFDCQGDAAPGISFTIDKPGARWYFVGGLPSSTADETAAGSGLGGFINVAPGIAVVNAELPGSPLPIAAPKTVLVRAGWMTALRFIPKAE